MGYTDAVSRIGQIQDQIASLRSAFVAPAPSGSTQTVAAGAAAAGVASLPAAPAATSFSDALSSALSPSATSFPSLTAGGTTGAAALPTGAAGRLTSGQQQFASRLATDTGLDPGVVSAWVLSEESGGAAVSRQSAGNNDWLNIGYTGSGTYGASDAVWSDPLSAADATAGWLKGQNTIPGYGPASSGVQAILTTAGQPPSTQITALQNSGWAGSGYPDLPSLYSQLAG